MFGKFLPHTYTIRMYSRTTGESHMREEKKRIRGQRRTGVPRRKTWFLKRKTWGQTWVSIDFEFALGCRLGVVQVRLCSGSVRAAFVVTSERRRGPL